MGVSVLHFARSEPCRLEGLLQKMPTNTRPPRLGHFSAVSLEAPGASDFSQDVGHLGPERRRRNTAARWRCLYRSWLASPVSLMASLCTSRIWNSHRT